MKGNIDRLLEKYWAGETSLAEERELKSLLSEADGFEEEKLFFGDLEVVSHLETDKIKLPLKRYFGLLQLLKIAAILLFFLIATTAVFRYQDNQAEKEAYLAVMQAFEMINGNMQKGTSQMEAMDDFRHLNKSHELFNLKDQQ